MMGNHGLVLTLMLLMPIAHYSFGFSIASPRSQRSGAAGASVSTTSALNMGLFDGISKAFTNQEYKSEDQRVRASHILIKGEDVGMVIGTIKGILGEINERVQQEPDKLQTIFSELARRESQCPSSAQGGDLGMFGPGKMVKEFDEALFPDDDTATPPAGSVIGPVVTDFGCHVILVTQRESNRDQVEEKLARND